LFDANLLIPACLYPNGVCAKAYSKAFKGKNNAVVVCTHTLEEVLNSCNKKFPTRMIDVQSFMSDMLMPSKTELIRTPPESERIPEEELIRDIKDRPLLRAAVAANVDMIVTGDKDFLESGLTQPKIISPAGFVNL